MISLWVILRYSTWSLFEFYVRLKSVQLPFRPSRQEVKSHFMIILPSLTCSKCLRKIECTVGNFCSSEQWWLTVEIEMFCSMMLWKYDITEFHNFSTTISTWVEQNFHLISYPESIICHTLNKPLFQWWETSHPEYKRAFSCPVYE